VVAVVEAMVPAVAVATVPAAATEADIVKLTESSPTNRGKRQAPQLNAPLPLPSF
jgi:hypothetical protein